MIKPPKPYVFKVSEWIMIGVAFSCILANRLELGVLVLILVEAASINEKIKGKAND